MFGYIACRASDRPPSPVIGGARFRAVYVVPGESLRARLSARSAARALCREGVREAVFPAAYPYRAVFARHGVTSPPLAPLYHATAAAIVRRYLAQTGVDPRRATVAFVADRVTPELRRAVFALSGDVRYLALAIPRDCDALTLALKRERGVAARACPPGALPRADLVVAFDGWPAGGAVLRLDGSADIVYCSELPNELLAALHLAGALDTAALRVQAVTPTADR